MGLSVTSAYGHRQRWPAFAERWDEALALGYKRLHLALVGKAGRMLDPDGDARDDVDPMVPLGRITIADALHLMKRYRPRIEGTGRPGRRPPAAPARAGAGEHLQEAGADRGEAAVSGAMAREKDGEEEG